MATTHIHRSPSQRAYERQEKQTSYSAVWAIVALAVIASIAYGYYFNEAENIEGTPLIQAATPATDGSTSSMIGTGTPSNELTPSVVSPGAPDTTTTESTNVPADGIQ